MRDLLFVAIGGAVGAVLRYVISVAVQQKWTTPFPLGTLCVNVIGCFAIGLAAQAHLANVLSPVARLMIVTGLLGALTTFSTFGHETYRTFFEHGGWWATGNIAANVIIGLLAVVLGAILGRFVWPPVV